MKNVQAPERAAILTRLRRVEGQVRGIQRMIEEDRECEAIVTQLMAARAALDRAGMQIMTRYISVCLTEPGDEFDQKQLDRIISFFFKFAGQASTAVPAALMAEGNIEGLEARALAANASEVASSEEAEDEHLDAS